MPWKETDVQRERVLFVVAALQDREPLAATCRRFGISRKTGYKWLRRFEASSDGLSGLTERSRRPRHSPSRTDAAVEARVVALRRLYGWGGRKLQHLLAEEGIQIGHATVDRILKRRGLIQHDRQSRSAVRRFERSAPNELVQMDFKGPYKLANDELCWPLSSVDDHSRYALTLAPLASTATHGVERELRGSFERYGVPEAMLVDHGTPWWSSTSGYGLTRLGVFLIRQGVRLTYSGIGHPQTQGKVERFHRTLADWLRHHGAPSTRRGFGRALEAFRLEYNTVRPHEGIGMRRPVQLYRPSSRPYRPQPARWQYPPGSEVATVRDNGAIYLGGHCFVSEALVGRRVRIQRFQHRILVAYRHMLVREIDLQTRRSRPILRPYGPTGHPPPEGYGKLAKPPPTPPPSRPSHSPDDDGAPR